MYHDSWGSPPDKSYEVGPFIFCSSECRDKWSERFIASGDYTSFRSDIVGVEKVVNEDGKTYSCDWCNCKNPLEE